MELKVVLQLQELRIDLVKGLLGKEDVSHEQVGDQVEENQDACTSAKGDMKAAFCDF